VEYVSKKVPADAAVMIRELQARYVLATKKRVSEGTVVKEAVAHALDHFDALVGKERKSRSVEAIIGLVGGGPRTNAAKEIDKAVYRL